jgi:hypothetical protein
MTGVSFSVAADGGEPVAAPSYRAEVVASGMAFLTDVIEPSRGVLYVSVGSESPGGRLLRFTVSEDAHAPLAASQSVQLWSRDRLSPIVAYKFSIRVYAGVPDQGRVIKLPELIPPWRSESATNLAAYQSTPESLIEA